jgi:hypothetical protein
MPKNQTGDMVNVAAFLYVAQLPGFFLGVIVALLVILFEGIVAKKAMELTPEQKYWLEKMQDDYCSYQADRDRAYARKMFYRCGG